MRPLFAAILLVASCASPACSPSSTSPGPPPAAEGECSLTADGLQQRPACAASGCEGELVRSDGKIECFSATEPGRLVFWVDVGADRRIRFEPKSTGLGDGVMESHCDADGKPLFEIARAGDQAECRCFASGQCPDGCISALAPACCPRNAVVERIESCSGSVSPEAIDFGDSCGMSAGEACQIGTPGCQLGRCQPLRSSPDGPAVPACCPAIRRPERPPQG